MADEVHQEGGDRLLTILQGLGLRVGARVPGAGECAGASAGSSDATQSSSASTEHVANESV